MKKNQGFTLIELLIVIGIIGILTGLAVFNFSQARERARDVQRKSDIKQVQNALEMYKNDQTLQVYPNTDYEGLEAVLVPSYMDRMPLDPLENSNDGTWEDYTYTRDSSTTYTLTVCLENEGDAEASATECGANDNGRIKTLDEP